MATISPPLTPLHNRFAVETYPNVRGFITWKPQHKSLVLLDQIGGILGDYINLLPLSIRQIFYRMVAVHNFPKYEKDYNKLINLLGKARRARYELVDSRLQGGRILLFDAIRDDKFVQSQPYAYRDARHFLESCKLTAKTINLDRQEGQPQRLVFWCEAKGMIPMLENLVHRYGIPVFSCGGVDSITAKYRTAMLWARKRQPITILHIGDQDPMGLDLMLALAEDLISFAGRDADIEFMRLAITPQQAASGGEGGGPLISAPPKEKRNGAEGCNKMLMHLSTTGESCTFTSTDPDLYTLPELPKHTFAPIDSTATWQAEALDPNQFATIVEEAIDERLDRSAYEDVLQEEVNVRQDAVSRILIPLRRGS